MKALVVRDTTGKIVCMGPDDGNYNPGVPPNCTKAIEPDYDTLLKQHNNDLALRPRSASIEERLKAVEDQLAAR